MSSRWPAGIIRRTPVVPSNGAGSGIWSVSEVSYWRQQGLWPAAPGIATSVTATAGFNSCATVAFTAPTCKGYPATITQYTVTSCPGGVTATGAASPITVSGLTVGTTYTFKVRAANASGLRAACSAPSNSATIPVGGAQAYTTFGTYSFVVPCGVTSISMVAVGGGGGGNQPFNGTGGGGGALAYTNNYTVTPGDSLTINVGVAGNPYGGGGGLSRVIIGGTPRVSAAGGAFSGGGGTSIVGTGGSGGSGGAGGTGGGGGGGAGGYTGNGGNGGAWEGGTGGVGTGGGAGGNAGSKGGYGCCFGYYWVYGGGGNGTGSSILGAGGGGTLYGYGGGGGYSVDSSCFGFETFPGNCGSVGAVRLVWPGNQRLFPSTNVK